MEGLANNLTPIFTLILGNERNISNNILPINQTNILQDQYLLSILFDKQLYTNILKKAIISPKFSAINICLITFKNYNL